MSFETEVRKILRREGGYNNNPNDRGGETNFGISSKAHPNVDIKSLTEEKAVEIYRREYWDRAKIDSYPAEMQGAIFDAAVQHGAGTAVAMAKKAGNDLAAFNQQRAALYRDLIRRDPSQRAFAKGWAKRLAEFGGVTGEAMPTAKAGEYDTPRQPTQIADPWNTSASDLTATDALLNPKQPKLPENKLAAASAEWLARLSANAAPGVENVTVDTLDRYAANPDTAIGAAANIGLGARPATEVPQSYFDAVAAEQARANAEQQDKSTWDQLKYRWVNGSSATGSLYEFFTTDAPESGPVEPGLKYTDFMDKWEAGRTLDEIEELRDIGTGPFSIKMIENKLAEQDKRRKDAEVMRGASTLKTFGLDLLAGTVGDPVGMLASFGAYKGLAAVGLSARSALAAGQYGRAIGIAGAEGAAGNVAITGIIDAAGGQVSVSDYAAAAGFGFAFGIPFLALDVPGARLQSAREEFNRIANAGAKASAERRMYFNDMARQELGAGADEQTIARRAEVLDMQEAKQRATEIHTQMPDEERLYPMVEGDSLVPEPAAQAAPTEAPVLGDMTRATDGTVKWSESRELRDAINVAEQTGEAAPLLRTVAGETGTPAPLRGLAAKVASIAEKFGLRYVPNSELDGDAATWGGVFFRDTNAMSIKMARSDFIVHEGLHGITSNIISAPVNTLTPELRAAVGRLRDLQAHVQVQYGMGKGMADDGLRELLDDATHGPLGNLQEFVTYAMTDKNFQKFLSGIESMGGKVQNAWDWFKNAVADMLGLSNSERTALDEVLEAGGKLVDTIEGDIPAARGIAGAEQVRAAAMAERANADAVAPGTSPDSEQLMPANLPPGSLIRTKAQAEREAKRLGLDATISDPVERTIITEMYLRAERVLANNPIDEAKLKPLLSQVGLEASSTRMMLSKNPVMKAAGILLAENPEGAGGRRLTASLVATTKHRIYVSSLEPEYEKLFSIYAAEAGVSKFKVLLNGETRAKFDAEVFAEMINRWQNTGVKTNNKAVALMADKFDQGYSMMGRDFVDSRALGWARIPVGVKGYFPRVVRGDKLALLGAEERRIMVNLLSSEFVNTAGFDQEFADKLAVQYFERAVDQSKGGFLVSLDLRSADTADVVRDALIAMKYDETEIARVMGRFSRGGNKYTKSRIDINLNAEHKLSDGRVFKLSDVFESDMLRLYKNYSRRISGEVALTQFGIMGSPGAKMLRKAVMAAPGEGSATQKEIESLDQLMSELIGTKYGDVGGVVHGNIRSLVSSAYLGGMGWQQLVEYTNGLHAVGGVGVLKAVAALPRLLGEVRRIGRGEAVDGILSSVEFYNGKIGADQYRLIGLRDVPDQPVHYGQDELGAFSLLVRGASRGLRILSMQRAIEAVQVRGMSEQIVAKALRYIRNGQEDAALADMGLTPALRDAMRYELGNIATWNGDTLVTLDLTKMQNQYAARTFAALVERGAGQIIQRAYPGEVGKWAHSDQLLLLTQFRTFPMLATQKQWRRVSMSQGTAKAIGYILGGASIAMPIHAARVATQSIGKEDGWLEEQLSPLKLGAASARYVSSLGLTSDVISATGSIFGIEDLGGYRGSPATGAIPAISYLNGLGQGVQNLVQEGDPAKLAKSLPGSSIPPVAAGLNVLLSED